MLSPKSEAGYEQTRHHELFRLTYVGHVVVEFAVVVSDRMIDMIELQKVLQCSSPFLMSSFDIMNFNGINLDSLGGIFT